MHKLPSCLADRSKVYWHKFLSNIEYTSNDFEIVTAFFDINRANWGKDGGLVGPKFSRTNDQYLECFQNLSLLKNHIHIFTDRSNAERVLQIRRSLGREDRTTIIVIDNILQYVDIASLLDKTKSIMSSCYKEFVGRPFCPEHCVPEYNIITSLKAAFVNTISSLDFAKCSQLAWIDFGCARGHHVEHINQETVWKHDSQGKISIFCFSNPFDGRPIFDIVKSGEVYIPGGQIVGPNGLWQRFAEETSKSMNILMECGLTDDDQTLFLMNVRRQPSLYKLLFVPPLAWSAGFYLFSKSI
jgi:protein YibB